LGTKYFYNFIKGSKIKIVFLTSLAKTL